MTQLDGEHAAMAKRVLREGTRGWRRWSTLCRRAGGDFSPFIAELNLLDALCRRSGLEVEDKHESRVWRPERFRVDKSVWPWLKLLDPDAVRAGIETGPCLSNGSVHG